MTCVQPHPSAPRGTTSTAFFENTVIIFTLGAASRRNDRLTAVPCRTSVYGIKDMARAQRSGVSCGTCGEVSEDRRQCCFLLSAVLVTAALSSTSSRSAPIRRAALSPDSRHPRPEPDHWLWDARPPGFRCLWAYCSSISHGWSSANSRANQQTSGPVSHQMLSWMAGGCRPWRVVACGGARDTVLQSLCAPCTSRNS